MPNRGILIENRNYDLTGCQFYADLWNVEQQGFLLSYDGDDYLRNATADFRSADSSGAIEVWFRSSSTANYQTLFASADELAGTDNYLFFRIKQTTGLLTVGQIENGGTENLVDGSTNVCDGKWHHAVLSSSGTAWSITLDGIAETLNVTGGANNGNWFADTTTRDSITIGVLDFSGAAKVNYAIAQIGFTRIYSRPMLQPEAQTNYQRGRKSAALDTTGLVFNLPCTEGTGNPVDTVGSLTMTVTGATWVEGLIDKSTNATPLTNILPTWSSVGRVFAGNGVINAPANTNYDGLVAGFTVLCWMKTDQANVNSRLVYNYIVGNPYWGLTFNATNKALMNIRGTDGVSVSSVSTTSINDNKAHFLVGGRTSALSFVYVDAVLEDSDDASAILIANPVCSLEIGSEGGGNFYTGTMGEVWIFNRALSQVEIAQIYNATRTQPRYQ